MLTKFDDFPIHQTAEPIAFLATSDRNAYGRYWFNGYDPDGEFYVGIAFAVYPNRQIMDCALSVVRKTGEQHSFRASRHLHGDRTELRVGPMALEIVDPMKTIRVTIDENSTKMSADLTFRATTPAHAEPLDHQREGTRVTMQVTRFSQFGMWGGWIKLGEERIELDPSRIQGVRDRSWGWRRIGEAETGVPVAPRQVFWLWVPLTWRDRCTHYGLREYPDGHRWKEFAHVFPRYASDVDFDALSSDNFRHARAGEHRLVIEPGSRFVSGGEIDLIEQGRTNTIAMQTLLRFHMMGIGYQHPSWGHGMYRGAEVFTAEKWNVSDLDKLAPQNQHVQNVVRATMDDDIGHGVIEQGFLGPHARYGLRGWLDPL